MKEALILIGLISLSAGSQLTCKFESVNWSSTHYQSRNYQTCVIANQAVTSPDFKIETFSKNTAKAIKMLGNKQVKYIPNNLAALPHLLAVDFQYCAISSIIDQFQGLQEVVYLHLGGNQIEEIQEDAFVDNVKLEWLGLHNNKLKHVNSELFKTLSSLKTLFLLSNQIEFIDPSAFMNLINLEFLNLDSNKLTFIDAKTFQNLNKLKQLHLYNNQIDSIESATFDSLKSVRSVYLTKNICLDKEYEGSSFLSAIRDDVRSKCKTFSMPRIEFKINDVKEMVNNLNNELVKEILNTKSSLNSEILKMNQNFKSEILNSNEKMTTLVENMMDAMMKSFKSEIGTLKEEFALALKTEQGRSEIFVRKNMELNQKVDLLSNTLKEEQSKVAELSEKSKDLQERHDTCRKLLE